MAWNSTNNKSVDLNSSPLKKAATVSVGAPVAYNLFNGGGGYHDTWDITKAYSEGMRKVTWVFRCIDVIASNQAMLPVVLRKDNNPFGEIVNDIKLLSLFNNTSNIGENAFAFRYRLSSQLLMSSRGAFVEVVRGNGGTPIALHLLPPQDTSPIPDAKTFVKGFEVKISASEKRIIRPENVIWIRRPHPLDPYLSMTPMEAAGVAIELENLAKIYNRNFLINDGRPGGLLVLRSEIAEEDKEELRSRFRGNIARAGSIGVISSDDGADFVDTAASPRDAAYIQMRTITKEEILASFGVPESIIGNSSGRTFSNALEEGKVFWMETMSPHLALIARSFDKLDDSYYIDFDTSNVPILVLAKHERETYYMSEFQAGLISANEYREASGRKRVVSDVADSLLANPNQTPIANTEKPMNQDTGMQGGVPLDIQASQARQEQVTQFSPEAGGFVEAGSVEGTQMIEASADQAPSEFESDTEGKQRLPLEVKSVDIKTSDFIGWEFKTAQYMQSAEDELSEILDTVFDDQEKQFIDLLDSKVFQSLLMIGVGANFTSVLPFSTLVIATAPIENFYKNLYKKSVLESIKTGTGTAVTDDTERAGVSSQLSTLNSFNKTTYSEILRALAVAAELKNSDESPASTALKVAMAYSAIRAIFNSLKTKRKPLIHSSAVFGIHNQAVYDAGVALSTKSALNKTWVSLKDDRVRVAHRELHGKQVPFNSSFIANGKVIRFPRDPLASPDMTINCRCVLKISK